MIFFPGLQKRLLPVKRNSLEKKSMIRMESHQLSSSQLLSRVFLLTSLLMIFLFSLFWNPEQVSLVPCFFHELTGHSCPSCGLTRSFHAIAHLNFKQAFEFHPMGIIVYVVLLAYLLKFTIEVALRKVVHVILKDWVKKFALVGGLFVWMGWWIIRLFYE
jgi:hypothetical protein